MKPEQTFAFTEKQPATYRDLDPHFVYWWAAIHELNTDTQENFREAAKELYARLFNPSDDVESLFDMDDGSSIPCVQIGKIL